MTYVRQNVYDPAAAETVEWYGKAVAALQQEPIATRQSWTFFAAMHGIVPRWWTTFGWTITPPPPQADQDTFWNQCQHQSWYFLPWHRGYILAFESMIRQTVVGLGGPESWALPYWDYDNPAQTALPPAFANSQNPLYIQRRYGPDGDGNVYIPPDTINTEAMTDPQFSGTEQAPEFGGIETDPLFSHSGNTNGDLENQPHNYVHGLVGGFIQNTNPNLWQNNGLMSMPPTAALDPIFWLHHCNIDRLWEGWNTLGNANPTDPKWLQGPAGSGERPFVMPMPDGTEWTYTPNDVVDIAALGYRYDALPTAPAPAPSIFLRRLGAAPADERSAAMTEEKPKTELVGASKSRISLARRTTVPVRIDSEGAGRVQEGFAAALGAARPARPGRVFLNLENVRGAANSMTYKVYVNVPEGENAEDHPERLAGTIGLFGISRATEGDGPHGGNGVSFSLDITRVLGDLHLEENFDPSALRVELVPRTETGVAPDVTVDRVSIYREAV